jgi:hypothetical protein
MELIKASGKQCCNNKLSEISDPVIEVTLVKPLYQNENHCLAKLAIKN